MRRVTLGRETLESVTEQLSDLADVMTAEVLSIVEPSVLPTRPSIDAPGTVGRAGQGKLGGRELNYSSDIDLIFVYEPDDEEDQSAHTCFQKLGRALSAP